MTGKIRTRQEMKGTEDVTPCTRKRFLGCTHAYHFGPTLSTLPRLEAIHSFVCFFCFASLSTLLRYLRTYHTYTHPRRVGDYCRCPCSLALADIVLRSKSFIVVYYIASTLNDQEVWCTVDSIPHYIGMITIRVKKYGIK